MISLLGEKVFVIEQHPVKVARPPEFVVIAISFSLIRAHSLIPLLFKPALSAPSVASI
jgi:hypothetical protein